MGGKTSQVEGWRWTARPTVSLRLYHSCSVAVKGNILYIHYIVNREVILSFDLQE